MVLAHARGQDRRAPRRRRRLLRPQRRRRRRARRGAARARGRRAAGASCNGCARTSSPGSRTAPAMAVELEARAGCAGNIVSWRHELWSNGHTHRPGRATQPTLHRGRAPREAVRARAGGRIRRCPRAARDRNAIPLYDFPDLLVVNHYVREMPVRGSSLRSLGAYGNVFAHRVVHGRAAPPRRGADPSSSACAISRIRAARAVLEKLRARRLDASGSAEGRGRGIAFAQYKNLGAYCAVRRRGRGRQRAARARAWSPRSTSACRSIPTASSTRSRAAASRRRAGR